MRARVWLLAALATVFGLQVARAEDMPAVDSLVNKAISALRSTSYIASMRFISVLDGGDERSIEIKHVAPDLYNVRPLVSGKPADEYYIENAAELVRVYRGNSITMPSRQFAVNDALTRKFLRELSEAPGTLVLSGQVGERKVYMLRRDPLQKKPYTITVGVDAKNSFPLYLLVTDSRGIRKVYYQMDAIRFVADKDQPKLLPDELFTVAEGSQQKVRAPQSASGGGGAVPSRAVLAAIPLPLYPNWLPGGYEVEAINRMSCELGQARKDSVAAQIYQLEAYGPNGELLSIFQTQALDSKESLSKLAASGDLGFVAVEQDGWTIAIFGDVKHDVLMRVAGSLSADSDRVMELLEQTRNRDQILESATN